MLGQSKANLFHDLAHGFGKVLKSVFQMTYFGLSCTIIYFPVIIQLNNIPIFGAYYIH